jgi:hypothetical protein
LGLLRLCSFSQDKNGLKDDKNLLDSVNFKDLEPFLQLNWLRIWQIITDDNATKFVQEQQLTNFSVQAKNNLVLLKNMQQSRSHKMKH